MSGYVTLDKTLLMTNIYW